VILDDDAARIERAIEVLAMVTLLAAGRSRLEALVEVDEIERLLNERSTELRAAARARVGGAKKGAGGPPP
jgi:hypothetical protein